MTIATFTTTMGNQEGVDNINGAFDKTIGHIHDGTDMNGGIISYNSLKDKPTNMATANKLSTPRTINGVAFDGSENIAIAVSSGQVGTPDNIVNGLTITAGTGLQAIVGTDRAIIDETVVSFTDPLTIALEPRMASLIYAKVDGSIGKIDAKYPIDMIDNNTIGFWVPNKTGNIPNLAVGKSSIAVANDLVPSGNLTVVDGHCDYAIKGDGSTGFLAGANITGIPNGNNPTIEVAGCIALNQIPASRRYLFYIGVDNAGFGLCIDPTGLLVAIVGGTDLNTGFIVDACKEINFTISSTAGKTTFFIGNQVYTSTTSFTIATGVFRVLQYTGGSFFAPANIDYIEIRNALRTPAQIAQISNALLLPCHYIDNGVTKDIRSILPASSISLGYAKTNSTSVIEIDEKYNKGRIEGAVNGNRKITPETLGWKYSTGTTFFDNNFGTTNIRVDVYIKATADAITWTKVPSAGVVITPWKINLASTGTGYISVIAEVIE